MLSYATVFTVAEPTFVLLTSSNPNRGEGFASWMAGLYSSCEDFSGRPRDKSDANLSVGDFPACSKGNIDAKSS